MLAAGWRQLALNGGQVTAVTPGAFHFELPPVAIGYGDAQIDDYGGRRRRDYPWRANVRLRLTAKFSHRREALVGTAGFGFWNAPFGDPTVPWPTLPQATWFFFASAPSDLPLAPAGPGRGWFAATLDAGTGRALATAPLALPLLLAQRLRRGRRLWQWVQPRLGITFAPVAASLDAWHSYEVEWQSEGCTFRVDGATILATPSAPRGPLGFVCWLDNQYLVARPDGRLRWGTLATTTTQWLAVRDLSLTRL